MFKSLGDIWYRHYIRHNLKKLKKEGRKLVREYITRKIKTMFVKLVNVCMYIYVIVNDYKIKYEDGKKEQFKNALCS